MPLVLRAQRLGRPAALILALVCGGCSAFPLEWPAPSRVRPIRKLSPPVAYEMIRDSPGDAGARPARAPASSTARPATSGGRKNIPLARLPYRLLEIIAYREETFLIYCEADECAEKGTGVLLSRAASRTSS